MKLSVCMITYNHEDFIAQALDRVLMQQVDFDYEIVIGEDCSTDNTRNNLIDYENRFPDRIKLLLNKNNLGMMANFIQTVQACQGEYIALCEGDDYWTDPCKLQKQVDFLDNHPECALCFHNVTVEYEDGRLKPSSFCAPDQKEISTLTDLLEKNFIQTCSVVFRRGLVPEFPRWYYELPMGDWPLHVLNAEHGQIGYLDAVMGVHRVHSAGAWSSLNRLQVLQQRIDFYDRMESHLGREYHSIIRRALSRCYAELAEVSSETGDSARGRRYAVSSLTHWRPGAPVVDRRVVAVLLRLWAPPLYATLRPLASRLRRHSNTGT